MFSLYLVYAVSVYLLLCMRLYTSADALMVDSMVGLCCVFSVCLCVSADALFIDGVVGVSQQDVGETGLQQVHGQEGRLLHNLKHTRQHRQTVRAEVFRGGSVNGSVIKRRSHRKA